jgi:hypothetical protein
MRWPLCEMAPVRGTPMRYTYEMTYERDARLWETRLWDGFCEKHAYERRACDMAACERHADEMVPVRSTSMRDAPTRDTPERHAYHRDFNFLAQTAGLTQTVPRALRTF